MPSWTSPVGTLACWCAYVPGDCHVILSVSIGPVEPLPFLESRDHIGQVAVSGSSVSLLGLFP